MKNILQASSPYRAPKANLTYTEGRTAHGTHSTLTMLCKGDL